MKRFPILAVVVAIIFSLAVLPVGTASAAIADGTYHINYEVKEANSQNTSIADGYFSKPATLTVENGTQYIQITLTGADMIKSLSAPSGPVSVVSDSGDTRVVKFRVDGDLSQPVTLNMNIVVPDLYDSNHTARAVFNVSGLPSAGSGGGVDGATSTNDASGKVVDNPRTGDDSSIMLYTLLLVGAAGAFVVVRKLRPRNN